MALLWFSREKMEERLGLLSNLARVIWVGNTMVFTPMLPLPVKVPSMLTSLRLLYLGLRLSSLVSPKSSLRVLGRIPEMVLELTYSLKKKWTPLGILVRARIPARMAVTVVLRTGELGRLVPK